MRGVSWFRRRRPQHRATAAPAPLVSTADKIIAAHHGLTEEQWAAKPALVQQDHRETVAFEMRAAS